MRKSISIISTAIMVLLSSLSWAENVTLRGTSPQGGDISVRVLRSEATRLRSIVQNLNRAGCQSYLNLWKKTNNSRSYPAGQDYTLVTAVKGNSNARSRWVNEFGKNSIGFICNGSPQETGYSGYVRIGDMAFTYDAIRNEYHTHGYSTRPIKMNNWDHAHVESTFEATPAEVNAFKAFYFARNKGAILNPSTGETHLPEWVNPGRSSWTQEGCAGASTSALNSKWVRAFRFSLDHIRAEGRRLGISEMANATEGMADVLENFTNRYGLEQNTTPKTIARSWGVAKSKMITIFNADDEIPNNIQNLCWDQKHSRYDGDMGWGGLCKYKIPNFPDKSPEERGTKSFRNARVNPLAALNEAL